MYTTDAKGPFLNQIRQRQSYQTLTNCDYDIGYLDLGRVFLVLQIELSCDFAVAVVVVVVATGGDELLRPRLKIDFDMAPEFGVVVVVVVDVESVDS